MVAAKLHSRVPHRSFVRPPQRCAGSRSVDAGTESPKNTTTTRTDDVKSCLGKNTTAWSANTADVTPAPVLPTCLDCNARALHADRLIMMLGDYELSGKLETEVGPARCRFERAGQDEARTELAADRTTRAGWHCSRPQRILCTLTCVCFMQHCAVRFLRRASDVTSERFRTIPIISRPCMHACLLACLLNACLLAACLLARLLAGLDD
jgi:hypothetical protein